MDGPEHYHFTYRGALMGAMFDHDVAVELYEQATGKPAPLDTPGGNTLSVHFTLPNGNPALYVIQTGFEESELDLGCQVNGAAVYVAPSCELLEQFLHELCPSI
jgi:hypothetical protein